MLRVGLTGGMGSGKSTVAQIFSVLGAPVYDADAAAKRLMQEYDPLKKQMVETFGEQVYLAGKLNREWLASKVFNDAGLLSKLNSLVHPETIRDSAEWMSAQTAPYIIKEAALIFESGSNQQLDLVIGVSSPLELRMRRVRKRDKLTDEAILARMKKQMPEEEKMALCDFIVINDETQLLIPQVWELHQSFTTGTIPAARKNIRP